MLIFIFPTIRRFPEFSAFLFELVLLAAIVVSVAPLAKSAPTPHILTVLKEPGHPHTHQDDHGLDHFSVQDHDHSVHHLQRDDSSLVAEIDDKTLQRSPREAMFTNPLKRITHISHDGYQVDCEQVEGNGESHRFGRLNQDHRRKRPHGSSSSEESGESSEEDSMEGSNEKYKDDSSEESDEIRDFLGQEDEELAKFLSINLKTKVTTAKENRHTALKKDKWESNRWPDRPHGGQYAALPASPSDAAALASAQAAFASAQAALASANAAVPPTFVFSSARATARAADQIASQQQDC